MKFNILKPLLSNCNNIGQKFSVIESDIYITKLDFNSSILSYVLECSNIKLPYKYKLKCLEINKIYEIQEDSGKTLFLLEITDSNGIDFD